jgi:1-acyl-sn-glycerol-3-phosphate acyltransferase
MGIKKAIASTFMTFSRWHFVYEDMPPKAVVIGAPHTSYWDGWLMVMAFWKVGRPFRFLVKDSAVNAPVIGPIIRWVGGISIDRSHSNGVVGSLVHQARVNPTFTVIIAPKGTRSPRKYWKSGFYRIALETGLPVQLGFINRKTHTYGWAGNLHMTGDVTADMNRIRAFYDGKVGFKPQNTSVPRLRAEDDPAAREWLLEGIDLK